MNETVREWVNKAEGDFNAASTLMRARKHPYYEGVCFHAQQCIEKLMKAALIRRELTPPRIHDLFRLSKLIGKTVPEWSWDRDELKLLTKGAVLMRYPGIDADRAEAREAMRICRAIRKELLKLI